MDFYSDAEQSAYRPWITITALRQKPNFTYVANQLALSFAEGKDSVTVTCLDTVTKKHTTFRAKRLVLAPGVLGTARIALRSLAAGSASTKLPLLCNPYSYTPCLLPAGIGQEAERRKLGFSQLSLFLDEDHDNFGSAMASLYSYQSLMLFRMVRQVPLNFNDARLLLQYLTSGFVIMGIHQPDNPGPDKYLQLLADNQSPTGDALHAVYEPSEAEQTLRKNREQAYVRMMRSLGVYAVKRIDPGFGSSIHYAGVLPFSATQKPFSLAPNGRLHGTKSVFVADGSGFTHLPAKGLTFSLMANAHVTAQEALGP
jgi:hypothetical protein